MVIEYDDDDDPDIVPSTDGDGSSLGHSDYR